MYSVKKSRFLKYIIPALVVFSFMLAAVTVSAQERLSISVNTANVRSGPGTEHAMLWRMEKYTPLKVVARQGEWIFFEDFEKTRGWMHRDLVSSTETIITTGSTCNIRTSPGTDHEIRFQAESGVPFKVLERRGPWIHIEHADGDKGWIHESLVW